MRIHTNATLETVTDAVIAAKAEAVTLTEHHSRTHAHGYEVKLEGSSKRRPNGGASGVVGGTGYAATWDQWGVFLAHIFDADPNARCGSQTHPIYADEFHFHARTAGRFEDGWPEDAHGDHTFRFQGVPYSQQCTKCSAQQRWDVLANVAPAPYIDGPDASRNPAPVA